MSIPPMNLRPRFQSLEADRRSLPENTELHLICWKVGGGLVRGTLVDIGSAHEHLVVEPDDSVAGSTITLTAEELNNFIWAQQAARKRDLVLELV